MVKRSQNLRVYTWSERVAMDVGCIITLQSDVIMSPPKNTPPSYDSLYGKLKRAKSENEGSKLDMCRAIWAALTGGVLVTIIIILMAAIPITMIVIGSMHLHDCPAQRLIPIYLIVSGVFSIVRIISSSIQRCLNHKRRDEDNNSKSNPVDGIIGCFLLAWFIAGNVWIYGLYGSYNVTWQDQDPSPTVDPLVVPTEAPLQYCHHLLYWFSFWITTASYILAAVGCCCCCVVVLVAAVVA